MIDRVGYITLFASHPRPHLLSCVQATPRFDRHFHDTFDEITFTKRGMWNGAGSQRAYRVAGMEWKFHAAHSYFHQPIIYCSRIIAPSLFPCNSLRFFLIAVMPRPGEMEVRLTSPS